MKLNVKLRCVGVFLLFVIIVGLVTYHLLASLKDYDPLTRTVEIRSLTSSNKMQFWDDSIDMQNNILDDVLLSAEKLVIIEKSISIDNINVFYRESTQNVEDGGVTLLLLHGMKFSSKTWLDLKTISIFTAAGYRTIAIDLPGFGKSEKLPIDNEESKSKFLLNLIETLKLTKPVIVSPSFSGYYTLPLLVKNCKSFTGYIPVAPVGQAVLESIDSCHHQELNEHHSVLRERFNSLPDYFKDQIRDNIPDVTCIDTSTLVIHGEYDRSKSSALLSLLPNAKTFEIPNGQHPCYLQNPPLFHKFIYNFLARINKLVNEATVQ